MEKIEILKNNYDVSLKEEMLFIKDIKISLEKDFDTFSWGGGYRDSDDDTSGHAIYQIKIKIDAESFLLDKQNNRVKESSSSDYAEEFNEKYFFITDTIFTKNIYEKIINSKKSICEKITMLHGAKIENRNKIFTVDSKIISRIKKDVFEQETKNYDFVFCSSKCSAFTKTFNFKEMELEEALYYSLKNCKIMYNDFFQKLSNYFFEKTSLTIKFDSSLDKVLLRINKFKIHLLDDDIFKKIDIFIENIKSMDILDVYYYYQSHNFKENGEALIKHFHQEKVKKVFEYKGFENVTIKGKYNNLSINIHKLCSSSKKLATIDIKNSDIKLNTENINSLLNSKQKNTLNNFFVYLNCNKKLWYQLKNDTVKDTLIKNYILQKED